VLAHTVMELFAWVNLPQLKQAASRGGSNLHGCKQRAGQCKLGQAHWLLWHLLWVCMSHNDSFQDCAMCDHTHRPLAGLSCHYQDQSPG
jgi:hypothetical protein